MYNYSRLNGLRCLVKKDTIVWVSRCTMSQLLDTFLALLSYLVLTLLINQQVQMKNILLVQMKNSLLEPYI